MKAIAYFAAMLAVAVAGCSKPVVVTGLAGVPGECLSSDPNWKPLPNSDVTRSQAARNYQTNHEAFNSMSSSRAICRAGLQAAKSKG